MPSFVLQHGAWHGGWCWARVAERLRAAGRRVLTPTHTGLGDRKHLLSREITLDTFVADLVNAIEAEELEDIVLVGHSFGGIAITGAADRIPARIRHLVYLDSMILQPGQCVYDVVPPEVAAGRRKAIAEAGGLALPPPPPAYFGVPDGPDADWIARRLTPHPAGTYDSPLRLANPVGNGLPCTYIACSAPALSTIAGVSAWARAQPGWTWLEMTTCHDAMVTAPEALTRILLELA